MRDIKFRGISKFSNHFVYGTYHTDLYKQHWICTIDFENEILENVPVLFETVGQFTGLKDKNGNDIYEGDIVSSVIINGSICAGRVLFHRGCFMVEQTSGERMLGKLADHNKQTEIVGNIYQPTSL